MHPNLPLPPQPIITRWGSWIDAALYYAENFEALRSFLDQLDASEAKCIPNAKAVMSKANIKNELAFIKCHFSFIPIAIKTLEGKGLLLVDAIQTFKSIRTNLQAIRRRKEFLGKYDFVYNNNKGLKVLESISKILADGQSQNADAEQDDLIAELTPVELEAYKYAPITSCDVERSFSAYKRILEDCRRSFVFENLKKYVVIHCNTFE